MSTVEIELLGRLQRRWAHGAPLTAARALSTWGEHGAGWIALGVIGVTLDRRRRDRWTTMLVATVGAHAAAVVIKRVVRRRRPDDPSVEVLGGVPSALSFPSAHAASTTAAALGLAPMVGPAVAGTTVAAMGAARMLLGVHYPSDVAAGALTGVAAWRIARAVQEGRQ